VERQQGLNTAHTRGGAPNGRVRSAEWKREEPIQAEKHRWGLSSALRAEERQQGLGGWGVRNPTGERWSRLWSTDGNWGACIRGWGGWKWGYRVRNEIVERQSRQRGMRRAYPSGGALKEEELNVKWNRREWIWVEECQWGLRSAYLNGVAPQGGWGGLKRPTNVRLMNAVAPGVKFITGDGQNAPWYSSWETIPVAFFPLAYSDSAQWVAACASAQVCRVRGWKYLDVVGWLPNLSYWQWRRIDGNLDQPLPFTWTMISYHRQSWRDLHYQTDAP